MQNSVIARLVRSYTASLNFEMILTHVSSANYTFLQEHLSNGQPSSTRKILTSLMDIKTWFGSIAGIVFLNINFPVKSVARTVEALFWMRAVI